MTKDTERTAMEVAAAERKPYGKPTLTKGPVLSRITAGKGASILMSDTF